MPDARLSPSITKLILDLDAQHKDLAEIAQILNLKKVQVSTILAFHRVDSQVGASEIAYESTPVDSPPADANIPQPDSSVCHSSETPPNTGDVAMDLVEVEEEESSQSSDQIYVGDDSEYGDSIYWEPTNSQNPHLMIMGESGSGKTYAAQCLVAELAQRGIPSILFDYGQSFELPHLDEQFKKMTGIREYLIAEDGLPINPLQIFRRVDVQGPKSVATRVSDVFDAVYHLGDIQRKVVIDAIRFAFERAGVSETDSSTWDKDPPSLIALQSILEEKAADHHYANYRNAGGVSARLMTFFMLSSFGNVAGTWSWSNLFDDKHKVHILQFRGLEGKTQRVLVELLLWHLFFYLKAHGQGRLRYYVVLDEAHHLSFRESGPVNSLLREARKFGLGVMFASQQPEDFSQPAYSNSASKLVFQVTDPTLRVARLLAAKCTNYASPEEIGQLISVLRRGEAFFITDNRGRVVRLADFRKRATLWQPK